MEIPSRRLRYRDFAFAAEFDLSATKDAAEARQLMAAAFAQPHPMAIRYPRGTAVYNELAHAKPIPIGAWSVVNEEPGIAVPW